MMRGTDGGHGGARGPGDRALWQCADEGGTRQMGPKFCRCGIGNVGRVQQSRVVKTGCAGLKERTAANMHTRRAAEVVRIVGEGE